MADLERKTFDFLSILTALVVALYIGTAVWAMVNEVITWQDFLAAVGSPASLLLGYWVRGAGSE